MNRRLSARGEDGEVSTGAKKGVDDKGVAVRGSQVERGLAVGCRDVHPRPKVKQGEHNLRWRRDEWTRQIKTKMKKIEVTLWGRAPPSGWAERPPSTHPQTRTYLGVAVVGGGMKRPEALLVLVLRVSPVGKEEGRQLRPPRPACGQQRDVVRLVRPVHHVDFAGLHGAFD